MRVLFVSAEVSPFAKVGGLADVAGSLPKAIHALGHDIRIVMPAYKMILDNPDYQIKPVAKGLEARINAHWSKKFNVLQTCLASVPVYLIETDEWFTESDRSERIYGMGGDPYVFLTCAVLEAVKALDWTPDVVHTNDWHTGMIPVLMREREPKFWENTAAIFSIHNLAYQGEFGFSMLDTLELPHNLFNANQLETYGGVNFLKAGCAFSDMTNTVSPTYANEIQTPAYGWRLEGLMRHLAAEGRLEGILNGIDEEEFDPSRDPFLEHRYSADDLSGKAKSKAALLKELGLPEIADTPLCGLVTRLSEQKGIDLIVESASRLLGEVQIIVLGNGDPRIAEALHYLRVKYPDRIAFHDGFNLGLAPRIYAGSDLFMMPSSFEPCGLGQLIAMRYGTIPIVRKTGGLADTVQDGENGFVFEDRSSFALIEAALRAKSAYLDKEWTEMVKRVMGIDHAWGKSALEYVSLYERALNRRRGARPKRREA